MASIKIPILKLMEDFTVQYKVIAYKSNGGSNLKTCQYSLEGKVNNTTIYHTQQTMFRQDFFDHVLQGAYKADVLDCKSKDDESTIVVCISTVQKSLMACVTLAKNNSLGLIALTKAQNHFVLKPCKILTPIKTQ